jgi:peptide/nickel transport system permease protein
VLGIMAPLEAKASFNHKIGFDQPFLVRLGNYIQGLLKGDLGTSYRTLRPFADEFAILLPVTMRVGYVALIIATIIGVSLGILAAVKQFSVIDHVVTVTAIVFASIPSFFVALAMIMVFSIGWKVLPSLGVKDLRGYIMPVATLVIASIPSIMRMTRVTVLSTKEQDYVRTARAKGCSERRIIWKHTLKNAVLPIITLIGASSGTVIGGSVIVESVFSLPGVGSYLLKAINAKDIPIVMSTTLVLSAFFCITLLLVDVLYAMVDPRIRDSYEKGN